jgi:DNA-binding transcriptional MerR regulator
VQEIAQRINKLIQNGALCARSFVASGQRIEVVRVEQPHAKAVCQRRTTGGQKVYQAADLLEALEVVELHGLKVDRTYALQMIKQGLKEMPIDPHGVFGAVFQHAEACLAKSRSQSKAMAQFVSGGAASAARGRWDKVLEHVRKCVAANKTKIKGKSKQTQLTFRSGN